jgi:DNA polymerase (family X)
MEKREVSKILEEIGILLELKGEDAFKITAYLNASRTIEAVEDDLDELAREGRLETKDAIYAMHLIDIIDF